MAALHAPGAALGATGDEDEPFGWSIGGARWSEEGAVVLTGDGMDVEGGDLAGGFFNGMGERRVWVVRFRDRGQAWHGRYRGFGC